MEHDLKLISMLKLLHAQDRAVQNSDTRGVRVKSIKYIGKEDVYNMEVRNHYNYSVCGGFIMHNCMDAMRYGTERFQRGNAFSFD